MKKKQGNPNISDEQGVITLRPGKEESLLRRHPWVFSGAIASLPRDLEEGDEVVVSDMKDYIRERTVELKQ